MGGFRSDSIFTKTKKIALVPRMDGPRPPIERTPSLLWKRAHDATIIQKGRFRVCILARTDSEGTMSEQQSQTSESSPKEDQFDANMITLTNVRQTLNPRKPPISRRPSFPPRKEIQKKPHLLMKHTRVNGKWLATFEADPLGPSPRHSVRSSSGSTMSARSSYSSKRSISRMPSLPSAMNSSRSTIKSNDSNVDFFDDLLMDNLKSNDSARQVKWAYQVQPNRTQFVENVVPELPEKEVADCRKDLGLDWI